MLPGNPAESFAGVIEAVGDGAKLGQAVGQAMIADANPLSTEFNEAWKAMTVPGPVTNFLHNLIIGSKKT